MGGSDGGGEAVFNSPHTQHLPESNRLRHHRLPTGIVTSEFIAASKRDETTDACPACGVHGHPLDARYCRKCGERLSDALLGCVQAWRLRRHIVKCQRFQDHVAQFMAQNRSGDQRGDTGRTAAGF
jgi:ribosomal protein L40E